MQSRNEPEFTRRSHDCHEVGLCRAYEVAERVESYGLGDVLPPGDLPDWGLALLDCVRPTEYFSMHKHNRALYLFCAQMRSSTQALLICILLK